MRRLVPLAFLLLAGCSGDDTKALAHPAEAVQSIELAGKAVRTPGISLSWEGNSVHVGDAWEAAQRVFPEPRSAFRLRSLPSRFGRGFEAHGWETNENQGYGIITQNDLVVAAVFHAEDVEADYAESLLASQRNGTGDLRMNEVKNGDLEWSFWENGSQRLMVLLDRGAKGTDVTILMGDAKVLDALGATRPVATSPSVAPFLSRPPSEGTADKPFP